MRTRAAGAAGNRGKTAHARLELPKLEQRLAYLKVMAWRSHVDDGNAGAGGHGGERQIGAGRGGAAGAQAVGAAAADLSEMSMLESMRSQLKPKP